MNCKETEKLIPLFIEDELETDDLQEFLEHINGCEECKEELSIQFLITEGLARLEKGGAFDLQNELKEHIHGAESSLQSCTHMRHIMHALEGLIVILLLTLGALFIFL